MFSRRRRIRSRERAKLVRKRKLLNSALLVLIFILIVAASLIFAKHETLQITNIKIRGNSAVSVNKLKDVVEEYLAGTYVLLFPKSNVFIYPKRELEAVILDVFPRIEGVSFKRVDNHTLEIYVKEQVPHAMWCGEEGCYFMNERGLIFSHAPGFTGDVFFRFNGGHEVENIIGSTYLPGGEFERIDFFVNALIGEGVEPTSLTILDEHDFEILREDGSRIIMNRKGDFAGDLETLRSVLESEALKDEELPLDYIDLRFGSKVYFKTKSEADAASE